MIMVFLFFFFFFFFFLYFNIKFMYYLVYHLTLFRGRGGEIGSKKNEVES